MQTAFVHVVNLLNGTLAQSEGLMRGIGVKEGQRSRRAASVNPRNAGPDITDVVSPTLLPSWEQLAALSGGDSTKGKGGTASVC